MSATTDTPRRLTVVDIAKMYADGQRLAKLLYDMTGVIRDHLAAGRDLRTHVFSWHDPISALH